MKVEQVSIRSFGLLRNYNESFEDGVNIVEGANETGKSTLAAFIRYMLYGFGEETGVLSERERRINWATGTADGSMTVSCASGRYRIDRKTVRSGSGKAATYSETCEMTDLGSDCPVALRVSPGEELLGVRRELYESTAFLGQLTDAAGGGDKMRESVENLMFSGDENVNVGLAIAHLTEARDSLLAPDGKSGRIPEIRSRSNALGTRLSTAMQGQRELIAMKRKLDEDVARRDDAELQYKRLCDLKICFGNYQILSSFGQLHDMRQQAEDIGAEAEEYRTANSYRGFFPTDDYAADISVKRRLWADARNNYDAADETLRELESKQLFTRDVQKALQRADKHGGESQVLARHAALYSKYRIFLILSLVSVLLFAVLATVGIVHYLRADTGGALFILWIIACGILFVSGVLLTVFTVNRHETERAYCLDYGAKNSRELRYRMQSVSDCRVASATHLDALRTAHDREEATRAAYFTARNVLEDALALWGKTLPTTGDQNEFLDIFEGSVRDTVHTYRDLSERRAALDSAAEILSSSLSGFSEEEIESLVPPARRTVLAETTPEEITEGITYYEGQLRYFESAVAETRAILDELHTRVEDPAEISEQLSAAENDLTVARDRYAAYDTALSALTGADIRLRAELSPRLAHYAQELMDVMTDGKYTGMTVTDDLSMMLSADGDTRQVEFLSGGTRDIAYITMRLALIRLLYRETPPLCFDESFAHQDNDRCYSMLKVFLTLSERNGIQTFLFTCRSREYTVAKEIGGNCNLIRLI